MPRIITMSGILICSTQPWAKLYNKLISNDLDCHFAIWSHVASTVSSNLHAVTIYKGQRGFQTSLYRNIVKNFISCVPFFSNFRASVSSIAMNSIP